jgi:hypothetical protein
MPLTHTQRTLNPGRLYRASIINRGNQNLGESLSPYLFVNSGTVNIYSSGSATQPTALSQMTLRTEETGVSGSSPFGAVPKYIAIIQASGTSTEITSDGIEIQDLGAIS